MQHWEELKETQTFFLLHDNKMKLVSSNAKTSQITKSSALYWGRHESLLKEA